MKTKYGLLLILIGLVIVLILTILFAQSKEAAVEDDMYLHICPNKTYYSISDTHNIDAPEMGITLDGSEEECKNTCSKSAKCIGYLSDHNNICYIFQAKNINENVVIKYNCEHPVRNFYGDLDNTDSWRWGEWKADYPFSAQSFNRLDDSFWDVCNGNPAYWNFSSHYNNLETGIIVANPKECNDICTNEGNGCLGWRYKTQDQIGKLNTCYLYNKVNELKLGDYNYICETPEEYSVFQLGTWKTKVVPPEYIRKSSI